MRTFRTTQRRVNQRLQTAVFQDALSVVYDHFPDAMQQLADNDNGPQARWDVPKSLEDENKSLRTLAVATGAAALTLCTVGYLASRPTEESRQQDQTIAAIRTALRSPEALKATATCAQDIEKHIAEITPHTPPRTPIQPSGIPITDYHKAAEIARNNNVDCNYYSGITGTWRVPVDDTWIAVTKETILDPPAR